MFVTFNLTTESFINIVNNLLLNPKRHGLYSMLVLVHEFTQNRESALKRILPQSLKIGINVQ